MSDPFSFDYTSRDYTSLRADMISQIPLKVPEWTDQSNNDFGMAMLEMFAYVGDILNYYADRIANESYLQTATQRANVLSIARMLDYNPGGNIAATVSLSITNNSGATQVIPANTQVSTVTGDVIFETKTAVTITNGNVGTVLAVQGVTVTSESLGLSAGTANQDLPLFQTPVIDGSPKVFVDSGAGPVAWSYLEHLIDASASSQVYTLYTDAAGITHVVFGDGVAGSIPAQNATITCTYRIGGGSVGNVPAAFTVGATQSGLIRFVSTVPANITVTNPAAAQGGGDLETLDSIRTNAPKSLFALQRAITTSDYNQLAIRVPGIRKANTVAAIYSSPTVYVASVGTGDLTSGVPTTAFASLIAATAAYLAPLIPATATVTVSQPSYVPINVTLGIQVLSNYGQDSTTTAVVAALNNYFNFTNVSFAQRVSLSDIYALVAGTAGVQYVTPTVLSRTGSGLADVVLAANEIPISVNAGITTITVTPTGGIITP